MPPLCDSEKNSEYYDGGHFILQAVKEAVVNITHNKEHATWGMEQGTFDP